MTLPGWTYSDPIMIYNPGVALSNYQVLIIMDTVSLISAGKMNLNCADIRITDSDGSTLLNYWIESGCNTTYTRIWAKIPSIPSGSKTIYVNYTNVIKPAVSNGPLTFNLFDDFADNKYAAPRGDPNYPVWTNVTDWATGGSLDASAGNLRIWQTCDCGNSAQTTSSTAYGVWQMDFMLGSVGGCDNTRALWEIIKSGTNTYGVRCQANANAIYFEKNGTVIASVGYVFGMGTWYNLKVSRDETGTFKIYIDNVLQLTYTDNTTTSSTNTTIHAHRNCGYASNNYDNITIRNYISTDPLASTTTYGSAYITSTPSGARLWIDGIDKGVTTPYSIVGLAPGLHTYKLTLTGYIDVTGSFTITASTTTIVSAAFTGNANFVSIPSGARVWIDNADTGITTPAMVTGLSVGSHIYRLVLAGYQDAIGTFVTISGVNVNIPVIFPGVDAYTTIASNNLRLSDNRELYANYGESVSLYIYPTINTIGTIRISYDALPTSAVDIGVYYTVMKNGIPIPEASISYDWNGGPDTFTHITVDVNNIALSPTDTLELNLNNSEGAYDFPAGVRNFQISYDIIDGIVSFSSTPSGARLWIDNIDRGVITPVTLSSISTGSHTYKLTLVGYTDATGPFSITAGTKTIVPTVILTLSTGNVSFTSTPYGASIYIDDVFQPGISTPAIITGLSAGTHTYKMTLSGYSDVIGSFTITTGITTDVSAVLYGTAMAFLAAGD